MRKLTLFSVLAALFLAGCASTTSSTTGSGADLAGADPKAVALGKCLTDKGAVFYGTERCSHCKNQKSLFGAAMPVVPFVDCDKEKVKCTTAGIQGYPTWVFGDGSKAEGTQQLAVLAQKSNCTY